jgi:hypothetical protein
MFGLFKKVVIDHPALGPLTKRGGRWEGNINIFPNQSVPLELEGTKVAPHAETLAAALDLPSKLPSLIPLIIEELLEHLEPYKEALSDPDDDLAGMYSDPSAVRKIQAITTSHEAWAACEIEGVEVMLVENKVLLLVRIQSMWDEEHLLGAYFQDWQFVNLNGSV